MKVVEISNDMSLPGCSSNYSKLFYDGILPDKVIQRQAAPTIVTPLGDRTARLGSV